MDVIDDRRRRKLVRAYSVLFDDYFTQVTNYYKQQEQQRINEFGVEPDASTTNEQQLIKPISNDYFKSFVKFSTKIYQMASYHIQYDVPYLNVNFILPGSKVYLDGNIVRIDSIDEKSKTFQVTYLEPKGNSYLTQVLESVGLTTLEEIKDVKPQFAELIKNDQIFYYPSGNKQGKKYRAQVTNTLNLKSKGTIDIRIKDTFQLSEVVNAIFPVKGEKVTAKFLNYPGYHDAKIIDYDKKNKVYTLKYITIGNTYLLGLINRQKIYNFFRNPTLDGFEKFSLSMIPIFVSIVSYAIQDLITKFAERSVSSTFNLATLLGNEISIFPVKKYLIPCLQIFFPDVSFLGWNNKILFSQHVMNSLVRASVLSKITGVNFTFETLIPQKKTIADTFNSLLTPEGAREIASNIANTVHQTYMSSKQYKSIQILSDSGDIPGGESENNSVVLTVEKEKQLVNYVKEDQLQLSHNKTWLEKASYIVQNKLLPVNFESDIGKQIVTEQTFKEDLEVLFRIPEDSINLMNAAGIRKVCQDRNDKAKCASEHTGLDYFATFVFDIPETTVTKPVIQMRDTMWDTAIIDTTSAITTYEAEINAGAQSLTRQYFHNTQSGVANINSLSSEVIYWRWFINLMLFIIIFPILLGKIYYFIITKINQKNKKSHFGNILFEHAK